MRYIFFGVSGIHPIASRMKMPFSHQFPLKKQVQKRNHCSRENPMKNRVFLTRHIFLFFLFILFHSHAEVEMVELQWRQFSCDERCGALMKKRLENIAEVAEVELDQPSGLATLRWKPYEPFRFPPINVAIHTLGPDLLRLRVRVRGTLEKKGNTWHLRSLGDESQFVLLPNIDPKPEQTVAEDSPYGRQFSKPLIDKMLNAVEGFYVVIVEGPLLNPVKLPPYQIIIQDVTLSKLKKS